MKICNGCKKEKELSDFNKDKSRKDGYSYKCKKCLKNIHCSLYKNNKEKYLDKSKNYYKNNKENHLLRNKNYVKNNREKYLEYQQNYFNDNKDKIRKYKNEYTNNKYRSDYEYKIVILLRSRFRNALIDQNAIKHKRTLDLIGCSINELKLYLEKQFKPEMNWENHGIIWEIDHIKPCSSFDLTDIEQQKQCFHYTNLQPLFKTENRQKYNKYE